MFRTIEDLRDEVGSLEKRVQELTAQASVVKVTVFSDSRRSDSNEFC